MTLLEIRNQCREALGDFPFLSTLTLAVDATSEEFQVSDGSAFRVGGFAEIGSEVVYVFAISEEKIGVRRGARGTTPASHAEGSSIAVDPLFTDTTINNKINEALSQLYPRIYRKHTEELESDGTRILDISGLSVSAPDGIAQVDVEVADWRNPENKVWVPRRGWIEKEGYIQFEVAPAAGTGVRLTYATYWETLEEDSDVTTLANEYLPLVVYYVCGKLGEIAMRTRMRYEGFSVQTDPSQSTAADLMGIAGYDQYKFDTMIEAKRMPPLSYKTTPWRTRKRE